MARAGAPGGSKKQLVAHGETTFYVRWMPRTFIASDPRTGKHEAVIEVRPDLLGGATEADLAQLERRLYDRHIHAGLLVTPETAYFVHDSFKSLEFSSESYEVERLPTPRLLSRLHAEVERGEGLYLQVRQWLDAVSRAWWSAVPDEALPMMLPSMIGLAQADLEEYGDVLDAA